jgi:hypothetical protein
MYVLDYSQITAVAPSGHDFHVRFLQSKLQDHELRHVYVEPRRTRRLFIK